MSKMYPKNFPRENKSGGERKVFEHFKSQSNLDWYIIHSFRLPSHSKVVFGESDFVVIAPDYGIFTLEIKSGGVGFDGNEWIFINRDHEKTHKKRGPFQQAYEGMFEVERIINEKTNNKYLRTSYCYGYGVIFTDETDFPKSVLAEDQTWRLYQRSDGTDYTAFVKSLVPKFERELSSLGKHKPKPISLEEAAEIASVLRPEVECVAPLKSYVGYSEEDIIKLTEEQFYCLDDISENERTVVLGGAGTGKTLLATRDALLSNDAGEKVAVFCFNTNLAKSIRRSLPFEIDVFNFSSFMTRIAKDYVNLSDKKKDDEFFKRELPLMAVEALKANPIKYSKIIIDEFQDLCTDEYLLVIDELLEGGLFDGKFTFYADFAKQAIFNPDVSLDILSQRTFFAKKRLTVNCRNTKNIGNEIVNITGYEDTKYRLTISGEPVDYYSVNGELDAVKKLKLILKDLGKKGFESKDIVLLSPRKRENSILNIIDPDKNVIGNIDDDPKSYMALFATAQSFKGLESKIVIIIDIENYDDTNLMYVAFSRARSKMFVLESTYATKQRKMNMIGR